MNRQDQERLQAMGRRNEADMRVAGGVFDIVFGGVSSIIGMIASAIGRAFRSFGNSRRSRR